MSEPRPTIHSITSLEPPCPADTSHAGALRRHRAHWDHVEALIAAWLRTCWQPPAEIDAPARNDGSGAPRGIPGALLPTPPPASDAAESAAAMQLAPFALPLPPGVAAPPGPPDLKDLANAITCLRRVQDARVALERGLDGEANDAEDGPAIDPAAIDAALSRVLGRSIARAATPPAADPLRPRP